jgi:bacteriocin-like protein
MKTNFDVKETIFEKLELCVLDEKEMSEINGGYHYELIDGVYVLVHD